MYLLVTLITILAAQANSYILLQVRRDAQNRSNVDALIHKVVAPGKFNELVDNIARKQFSNRQMDLRNLRDIQMQIENDDPVQFKSQAKNYENQQAEEESGRSGEWVPGELLKYKEVGTDQDEEYGDGNNEEIETTMRPKDRLEPFFRARGMEIKPEVISFRSKPSLMYELDSNNLARLVKEFLSSKTVAKYTDKMAKRAAEYYETFRSSK